MGSIQTGPGGVPYLSGTGPAAGARPLLPQSGSMGALVGSSGGSGGGGGGGGGVTGAGAGPGEDDYVNVDRPGTDAVEDALQKCYKDVIQPVAYFLCAIGWRPFPSLRMHLWYHRAIAIAYPVVIAACLLLEYAVRISYAVSFEQQDVLSELLLQGGVTLTLWAYGLRFFRREDGQAFQEVSALIETVYLRCGRGGDASGKLTQTALTSTLRSYLFVAWTALVVYVGLALWLAFTSAVELAEQYDVVWWLYVVIGVPTAVGYLAENAVVIATILTYWISVRVHVRYADWIRDELVTRHIDLPNAERELHSLRRLVAQTNRGWAVPVSVLAFSLAIRAILFQIAWVLADTAEGTAQAIIGSALYFVLFLVTIYPAALFTEKSNWIANTAWSLRAEQTYRMASYVEKERKKERKKGQETGPD